MVPLICPSIKFIAIHLPRVLISRVNYSRPRTAPIIFASHHSSSSSTKIDIHLYMKEKRNALIEAMEEAVPIKEPVELYESMRYTILNGKMIGPLLCIAACELVGGKQEIAMPAACAIQMAMSMAVIHDDLPCIDDDVIRNEKPANHKVYGEPVALLAGDAIGAFAFHHLAVATKDVSPGRVLRAISELGKTIGPEVQSGQVVDVLSRGGGTLEQLEFINLHKTGSMYSVCMVIGGIVGGANDEEIEMLRFYGEKVGLIIQLVDDLSDIDEDLKNSQITYPVLVGVEKTREIAEKLNMDAHKCLVGFNQDNVAALIALKDHCLYDIRSYQYLWTTGSVTILYDTFLCNFL